MSELPRNIAQTLELLDERNRGYGKRPLPDVLDELLGEVIDFAVNGGEEARAAIRFGIDDVRAQFLAAYAERMASYAVRLSSPKLLLKGLIAVALAAEHRYYKEAMPVLALIHRSAEHLGIDPSELFEEARRALEGDVPQFLVDYPRGSAPGKVSVMGYQEKGSGEDFLYVRTW